MKTAKKNQTKFMFFENFLNAIEQLPQEEQAQACLEFCRYGITGNLPKNKYLAMFCLGVSASVQKYQGSGGARQGAGRPKKQEKQEDKENQKIQKNQKNQKIQIEQTETETETESETNKLKTENIIKNLSDKFSLREGQFRIDYNFSINSLPEIEIYRREVGDEVLLSVQSWLIDKKFGEIVDKEFICKQVVNFSKRRGLLI